MEIRPLSPSAQKIQFGRSVASDIIRSKHQENRDAFIKAKKHWQSYLK